MREHWHTSKESCCYAAYSHGHRVLRCYLPFPLSVGLWLLVVGCLKTHTKCSIFFGLVLKSFT